MSEVVVHKINPVVTHRCCPKCGYLELQSSIALMRYDHLCLGCGEHSIKEFQPVQMTLSE